MPGRAVTLADWFTGRVRGRTLDAVSGQHRVRLAARLGRLAAAEYPVGPVRGHSITYLPLAPI